MELGEFLKHARTRADLTQREVSKRTGINYKTISNWENNVSKPSPDDLCILADIYKTTTDILVGRKPSNNDLRKNRGYYHDPEVVSIANEMKENPDIRVLFDATRGLKKESIEEVRRFVEFQKARERGDYE